MPLYHKVVLENFKTNKFGAQKHQLSYLKFTQNTNNKIFENFSLVGSLQNTYESRISQKNDSNIETTEVDKVNTMSITGNIQSAIFSNWKANSGLEFYLSSCLL